MQNSYFYISEHMKYRERIILRRFALAIAVMVAMYVGLALLVNSLEAIDTALMRSDMLVEIWFTHH